MRPADPVTATAPPEPKHHRAPSTGTLAWRVLATAGLAALLAISVFHPATTRMYAWPWSLALATTLLLPALAWLLRVIDRSRALALPSVGWQLIAGGAACAILASAVASPYRTPSILWSAPWLAPLAVFFLVFDWLHASPGDREAKRRRVRAGLLAVFTWIAVVSVWTWCGAVASVPAQGLMVRNAFPFGHANYVAGAALLLLPTAVVALRRGGAWRAVGVIATLLALTMVFTSGSRGGFLGLVALGGAALWAAPIRRARKWQLTFAGIAAALAFAALHPRTRLLLSFARPDSALAASDLQRSAMFTAGLRMGLERPVLGWGPGTTPLAYPRFRGGLDGGAENVLQLHSLPVQLWAELGIAGMALLLGTVLLTFRNRGSDPVAALTLAGYAAFALTDWQLDIPLFGFAVATLLALIARPPRTAATTSANPSRSRIAFGGLTALAILVLALGAKRDPAPELNVRALALAADPAGADRAITLLRDSLALNDEQEIAHFNLGWLLLVRDPAAAERHFLSAARLVPDKGGVYFGLGLARLNQGKPDPAARAFAVECLNDAAFLRSAWWREPAIAALRHATAEHYRGLLSHVQRATPSSPPPDLVATLGTVPVGPERTYRRTRTGYPVLMRNADLAPPVDLYDVREAVNVDTNLPRKGWLPSPLLLSLLDAPLEPVPDRLRAPPASPPR